MTLHVQVVWLKNTGSAHDITGSHAIHRCYFSRKYSLQTWYLGHKLVSMVTPNAHLENTHVHCTTFVSEWYVDDQVSQADPVGQLVVIKQESGLASGQVCLDAAIVHGNSDMKEQ